MLGIETSVRDYAPELFLDISVLTWHISVLLLPDCTSCAAKINVSQTKFSQPELFMATLLVFLPSVDG